MRKIAEIRADLNAQVEAVKALDPQNKEDLQKGLDKLDSLMRELDAANKIEAAEQLRAEQKLENLQKKAGKSFSIVKFIREAAENKLSGLEAEVAEMGAEEYSRLGLSQRGAVIPSALLRSSEGQNAATAADGGNLVTTAAAIYNEELKEKLVVAQLGATVLTGLVGQVPVVTSDQIASAWVGEGVAPSGITKAAYAKVTMSPKRNTTVMAVSGELLRQTSFDVEADLMKKMADAHANLLEAAAIYGGGSGEPIGILAHNSVPVVEMGTNGGNITFAKVVELETKVNSNNGNRGAMAYLTNAKVWGALKTTEKVSGSGRFIMEDNAEGRVNGYRADFSNLVPSNLTKGTASGVCSALVFGNFQDLYIGQWGGIDVIVDPFKRKEFGEIEICLAAYNDVLVAQPKSFAVIKDIKTA